MALNDGNLDLKEVERRLDRQIRKIKGRTERGVIRAAIVIIRGTEKASPSTPVDTGNLRASRFVVTSRGETEEGQSPAFVDSESAEAGRMSADHAAMLSNTTREAKTFKGPTAIIGYTAFYAAAVHEKVGANFKRKRPPAAGSKWLAASMKRNRDEVLDKIEKEVKGSGARKR